MHFNHSNCKILTVSRTKAPVFFNYMLNNNSLEHITSFKDLGVLVSSDWCKKWNESGFRPPLCTYRLNWARRTPWGWWDDSDDTILQTQDSKFDPWRSEAEHATSRSRRLPTILTFTRCGHIDNVVSKCSRVNGMIKRGAGYHASNNVAYNLYKSLTRSIVEYCAPVWSSQNSKELTKLESIQRGMTRFVTKLDGGSYQDRCIDPNLLPLCFRREILSCFFSINV